LILAAPFRHRQSAPLESGVMSALMTHGGLPMSEPMAFGLAATLSFALIPLVKLSGLPLIAYRMPPGFIIRGVRKRLGLRMRRRTFRRQESGMDALDRALDEGHVVGLQASVYWLPYFPEDMRFHFNAHNLIVYGRDGDDYLVSDPVFEEAVRCDRASLMKARFAKGALAARGLMYYPERLPVEIDHARVIPVAIRANYRMMARSPLPFVGLRGIRRLGGSLLRLGRDPRRRDDYLPRFLGHIVRMQEEIGTGGAGFRFMYGAFSSRVGHLARLRFAARRFGRDDPMPATRGGCSHCARARCARAARPWIRRFWRRSSIAAPIAKRSLGICCAGSSRVDDHERGTAARVSVDVHQRARHPRGQEAVNGVAGLAVVPREGRHGTQTRLGCRSPHGSAPDGPRASVVSAARVATPGRGGAGRGVLATQRHR